MAMNEAEQGILDLIRGGENLAVEFKSDVKSLPDRDLIAAIVALANTEGGNLFLGIEDDGAPTGLHANHRNLAGLPALSAKKTTPSLAVRVDRLDLAGHSLARIQVRKSGQLVSAADCLLQRRRLTTDGTPEAVPFYPHEFVQRQSSLGVTDPSA